MPRPTSTARRSSSGVLPEVWRTDEVRAHMMQRGAESVLTMMQLNLSRTLATIPPNMIVGKTWFETTGAMGPQHTSEQILGAL